MTAPDPQPTLAAFLLARIAEDEAVGRAEVERLRSSPKRGGKTTAARRLAECEAKRRIVELHGGAHGCVSFNDGGSSANETYGPSVLPPRSCPTLRLLTLPYASHPEYRPEWRP